MTKLLFWGWFVIDNVPISLHPLVKLKHNSTTVRPTGDTEYFDRSGVHNVIIIFFCCKKNNVKGVQEFFFCRGPIIIFFWGGPKIKLGDRLFFLSSCIFFAVNIFFLKGLQYFCWGEGAQDHHITTTRPTRPRGPSWWNLGQRAELWKYTRAICLWKPKMKNKKMMRLIWIKNWKNLKFWT